MNVIFGINLERTHFACNFDATLEMEMIFNDGEDISMSSNSDSMNFSVTLRKAAPVRTIVFSFWHSMIRNSLQTGKLELQRQ
jgi:hypothetical protein